MLLLKIVYHIYSIFKILIYKIIYKGAFSFSLSSTFRKHFSVAIDKPGKIIVGEHCFFNNNCSLNCSEKITIGEGTIFGESVKIYDHNHIYCNPTIPLKEQGYTTSPISIGKHCWIGSNVIILKGVTIGDNCVVGAGCVIYKDIPANTVVYNNQNLQMKNI